MPTDTAPRLTTTPPQPAAYVGLLASQTLEGLGAIQGVTCRDGMIYAYGDAETGIVREYRYRHDAFCLEPTGRFIRLTQHHTNLLPHPTGIAHHPGYGTFVGDTVKGRGVIWSMDWAHALADGNLNRAVLNRCVDTEAVNGCRPEFVRYRGRWAIATSDYGDAGNELRLYDPVHLGRASTTSEVGLVIARFPCGPWVQSLHWLDDAGLLVLVQNQTCGLGYRLSFISLQAPEQPASVIDLDHPMDELEGFVQIEPGIGLFVNSSPSHNTWFTDFRLSSSPPVSRAA